MGNESSSFTGCVLEKHFDLCAKSPCNVYAGKTKDDDKVSVFVYDKSSISEDIRSNCIKYFKVLKFPGLVKLLGTEDKGEELWVITEYVEPLEHCLDTVLAPEVCDGLHSVLQSLVFLHDTAKLCHNNICPASVFITADRSWKLGGLELVTSFTQAKPSFLAKGSAWRSEVIVAPEEKSSRYQLTDVLGHTRDVYAFGRLVQYLIDAFPVLGKEYPDFETLIQSECLADDPRDRPHLNTLMKHQIFQGDLIHILEFLHTLTIHTEDEKSQFFSGLLSRLQALPPPLVAARLVKPLLGRFVLLDATANSSLLPHLLSPVKGKSGVEWSDSFIKPVSESDGQSNITPLLSEALFKKHVIPELFKIFHVRDAPIRIVLLKYFPLYAYLFEQRLLKALLKTILLGVRDTNDQLVALSLHALGHMVPLLGGGAVVGANRTKIFAQGTPKGIANHIVGPQDTNGSSPDRVNPAHSSTTTHKIERERKREELKRKAEERRKKRENNRISNGLGKINEEITDTKRDKVTNLQSETSKHHVTISQSDIKENNDLTVDQSETRANLVISGVDEKNDFSVEDAWHDDEDEDNDADHYDDDIDYGAIEDEIEKELSVMSVEEKEEISANLNHQKVVRLVLPHSTVPRKTDPGTGKGALQLKKSANSSTGTPDLQASQPASTTPDLQTSQPASVSPALQSTSAINATWDSWSDSAWSETSDKSSTKSSHTKTQSVRDSLQTLDIKTLDIVIPNTEPDFFADMKPRVELGSKSLVDMLAGAHDTGTGNDKFTVQDGSVSEEKFQVESEWDTGDWSEI